MRPILVVAASLVAVALMASCDTYGNDSSSSSESTYLDGVDTSSGAGGGGSSSDDPAALLAQRDGSSDVASYSAALDAWQAKCTQDRVTDAGYVDFAFTDEQKNGVAESSRLVVMQNLTASVPDGSAPTDCQAVTAAYLVMAEK